MRERGLKEHTKHKKDLPDKVSHAHVREAARELGVILDQLKTLQRTKHRAKAADHLRDAVKELNLALKTVKGGKKG
jgi:hypothetical protein